MPTTPILALPYPAATDSADVPRDIQALATRVESTLGGVVATSIPASPFDGQTIRYRTGTAGSPIWELQWSAADSRWYKTGGPPLYAFDAVDSAITPIWPANGALAPAVTIPKAGLYRVTFHQMAFTTSGSVANLWTNLSGPGLAATAGFPHIITCDLPNYYRQSSFEREVALTGPGVVQGAFGSDPSTTHSRNRSLSVDAVYLT